MQHHISYLDFQGKALYGSKNIFKLYFVVVVLVFYGLLTLVMSFQVQSVTLTTLFLGKPTRQFTST